MSYVHSFAPLSATNAQVLILGSMPGIASLKAQQYYAHPRNAFWGIMDVLFNIDKTLPYTERVQHLKRTPVSIWDTLKACTRSSSLDSDIVESSIIPNDFSKYLSANPSIKAIYFNGAKSETLFLKHVIPSLPSNIAIQHYQRLPSTSPAMASLSFDEKCANWQTILTQIHPTV